MWWVETEVGVVVGVVHGVELDSGVELGVVVGVVHGVELDSGVGVVE